MPRKYYKEGLSVDADKVIVEFICPNTNEKVSMRLYSWVISGNSDRMGCTIDALIKCKKCGKQHTIYLRND